MEISILLNIISELSFLTYPDISLIWSYTARKHLARIFFLIISSELALEKTMAQLQGSNSSWD